MTDAIDCGDAGDAGVVSATGQRVPMPGANFDRSVVSILGLPFDKVTLDQAVHLIRRHAFGGTRCFLSTPNLHFAIAALADPSFRDTVLRSDLNLIDGMPLVWIARLSGVDVPGRVAGSDVFDALRAHAGPPVKVYLFGGPRGAAKEACESINQGDTGGVRCVGFDEAGFGPIESMSSDEQIERINRSGAHFVIASLGAEKGQAWLEHNAARLTAPVLAHLGAVLNFAAGTVRRAPAWMRWWGVEWLWRIKEEPALWRRYWSDGKLALGVLLTRVIPDMIASRASKRRSGAAPTVELLRSAGSSTLRLTGFWSDAHCTLLRAPLAEAAAHSASLVVDLRGVENVSGTFVGLMLLARGWFRRQGTFRVSGANAAVRATLRRKLAEAALLENER